MSSVQEIGYSPDKQICGVSNYFNNTVHRWPSASTICSLGIYPYLRHGESVVLHINYTGSRLPGSLIVGCRFFIANIFTNSECSDLCKGLLPNWFIQKESIKLSHSNVPLRGTFMKLFYQRHKK
jgi:hypothetical protein